MGKGRQGNPRDKSGNIMKCFRCGSTEHLKDQCPQGQTLLVNKGTGRGKGSSSSGRSFVSVPPGLGNNQGQTPPPVQPDTGSRQQPNVQTNTPIVCTVFVDHTLPPPGAYSAPQAFN